MSDTDTQPEFHELNLSEPVLKALKEVGYETPSPIQAQTIPHLVVGRDVLGQAQTGTGKTAAFALPLLTRIDLRMLKPQVLVLAPTRELAIQVSEAFQRYAAFMRKFHVLPIYGGQDYGVQLRQLKRGVHVIVGTPGRVMDHLKRRTLVLDALSCIVLDEADEMLRMGFIQDVEWILDQTPPNRQVALFSATMPKEIRNIAQRHLKDPVEIIIAARTATVEATRQRYWMVRDVHKLDALTRILEAEPFEAMIVFVRTKTATVELTEKLAARGFEAAPLNGDLKQRERERTIERLRTGKLDILVATDVAARGLDVDRISHIINYDIPYDTEAYVHRIGRTGRAGRSGEAVLFVSPRETRMLRAIEQATRQKIQLMKLPTTEAINDKRVANFKQRITDTIAAENLEFYTQIIEQYRMEHNVPAVDIAAALAKLVQGEEPLLLTKSIPDIKAEMVDPRPKKSKGTFKNRALEKGMKRFRIEVGHAHGVKPGNIVGAIANEAGLDSKNIGRIDIYDDFSVIDLPEGMPREIFKMLKRVWVAGRQLNISRLEDGKASGKFKKSKSGKKRKK